MQHHGVGMKVQSQGRAYAAVIGVTVGMLVAGLAIPMAFGRTPNAGPASAEQVELDFDGDAGFAPLPNEQQGPGKGVKPGKGGQNPGAPGVDSGLPGLDPGAPGTDSGVPNTDSGVPGTDPGTPAEPGAPDSTAPSGPLTASDQGVTATSVKIGVIVLDIESLKPLGFGVDNFSPEDQRKAFQTFIDDANDNGGLSGRRMVPVFVTLNALDSNGSQSPAAVCSKLGEDEKVFAAMGYVSGNVVECLTQQHGIPVFSDQGKIRESYQRTPGYIVSYKPSVERGASNWGDVAARSGILRGRTIGTVSLDVPEEIRAEEALVSSLREGGYPTTYRSDFGGDAATVQSQLPIVVQQMRTAGVDTVFLATNFVAALQFVQTAERQGFLPLYVVSDFGSLTVDGLMTRMPRSFNNAIGFTTGDTPTNPTGPGGSEVVKCLQQFNTSAGENYTAKTPGAVGTACFYLRVLTAGGARVGADLTRKALTAAFQQLGSPALPISIAGSFGPGKTDHADFVRPLRYATSCRCYNPAGGAQKGRY